MRCDTVTVVLGDGEWGLLEQRDTVVRFVQVKTFLLESTRINILACSSNNVTALKKESKSNSETRGVY